jgi:hypothetical protein
MNELEEEVNDEERATLPQEASKMTSNHNPAEKSAFFMLGNPFPNNNRPFSWRRQCHGNFG